MVVGICGPADDPQVTRVRRRARELGSEVVSLDLASFPAALHLRLTDGVPSLPGVDLRAVTSWYVRSSPLPLPFPARADTDAYAAGRERRSFVAGFVAALRQDGAVLINPPEAAAGACGMTFTGIDLRRPDDRASVLLECNPSPMFAGIENRTRTSAVTEALVRRLRGELTPEAAPGTSTATACR